MIPEIEGHEVADGIAGDTVALDWKGLVFLKNVVFEWSIPPPHKNDKFIQYHRRCNINHPSLVSYLFAYDLYLQEELDCYDSGTMSPNSPLHRWLRIAFALLLCFAGISAAQALTSGDFSYTATATEVTIIGCSQTSGAVIIPSSIANLPVKFIGYQAFYQHGSLTSVIIPDSVTSIGDWAFAYCVGLTSVTIGSGVTSIGNMAFGDCYGLTSVTIGGGVTSIGDFAFHQCVSLTRVIIPDSVTRIGDAAFYGCSDLLSVTIGNGVTSISDSAFYGCSGLISLTIPNSVTSIGVYSFSECHNLTSVTIGNGVTSIGDSAFYSCVGLTSVTIGGGVTSIGDRAFFNCVRLTSVTIPDNVASIGNYAFQYCYVLNSVYFKGRAPSIGFNLFNECSPTIYYYAGAMGWGSTFSGRPTVPLGFSILTQPANVTALQWTSPTFTVTAVGATGYQWQKNGVNIPLATTAVLTLHNVQASDIASYTVIIYNPVGNVASSAASLTVQPDADADGLTDADEINIYHTAPNKADTDGDGLSDNDEIFIYHINPLLKDTDGDGFDDGFEVCTGFDPASVSSTPDSASSISPAVGFRFNAGLNMSYRIEDSSDLQNWNTLESPIIGQGGEVVRFYFTEGHAKRFFRVRRN